MDHRNGRDGSGGRITCGVRPNERCNTGTVVTVFVLAILTLSCHTCLGDGDGGIQPAKHLQPETNLGGKAEMLASSKGLPRILTVLTTYNQRNHFVKAYREAAADREDGYEPLIFATSDEEDEDLEGVIDYKFGEPKRHRLLAALAEATSRYAGQFDWIAAGDDDTVFLYKRAMALLRNIDHTQPVAIGDVHGFCNRNPRKRRPGPCQCFSPEEKNNVYDKRAAKGCCLDFTRPCKVPTLPEVGMNDSSVEEFLQSGLDIYQRDLYWAYGGTGIFLSAGLAAMVQGRGDGWKRCRDMFHENTDMQVGRCLTANGLTVSSFNGGFFRPFTAEPEEIREYLGSDCQVIGVHAGVRHLKDHSKYTNDEFKATMSTVWAEDNARPWLEDGYLKEGCPATWVDVMMWK